MERSRTSYGIQDLSHKASSVDGVEWRRRLSPWQKDKHLVGLEEDVKKLLREAILEETKRRLWIATVVGMGGIGKSTLAKKVYNHAKVAGEFDCRAWVVVSSKFDPRKIMGELIMQLSGTRVHDPDKLEMHYLQEKLHRLLQGKKYFIVVDDVWEDEHWDDIQNAFPDEDNGSRLLLTSRNHIATQYFPYVHEMKLLDTKESWQLLLKKAFCTENTMVECPKELEAIGKEILRRCDGLPLAIRVVGGLLADKSPSRRKWEKVLREINSHLQESGSIVSTILELSYRNLSPPLKSCFLCFGFFKEGETIRAEKLVQVWIALGLIPQESGGNTMEETGQSYLDDLISRNMVQMKNMSKDEQLVKDCHIHDLIRELCIRKAKEEICFEMIGMKEGNPSQSLNKLRHCTLSCTDTRILYSKGNKYLRSLFFHRVDSADLVDLSYMKSFKLLRILDFEGLALRMLPDIIGEVSSLRYLGLRKTPLQRLPCSLGRLKLLEVLETRNTVIYAEASVVCQMDSLRHLYTSMGVDLGTGMHLKRGTFKNLYTLLGLCVTEEKLIHFPRMTNLRHLGLLLEGLADSYFSKLCTWLAMLKNLNYLKLRCFGHLENMDELGSMHSITRLTLIGVIQISSMSAANFLPNLSSLTLRGNSKREDPMPVLEKLPKLLHLKLDSAYEGKEMVISGDGFPALKILCFKRMYDLENMKIGKGALQELKKLEIYHCPELEKNIPEELRSVYCLESIN